MIYIFFVYNILIPLLVLNALILVHEVGHYMAARWAGVTVKEFAIGMGPKLFSRVCGGIRYSVRALPIGGFVLMAGEDEASEDANAITRKPRWKRLIVLASGSLMNLLVGFIITAVMVSLQPRYATTRVAVFDNDTTSITRAGGLRPGDEIISIAGKRINIFNDLAFTVTRLGTEPCNVVVRRDEGGKSVKVTLYALSFPVYEEGGIKAGGIDFKVVGEDRDLGSWLRQSFFQPLATIDLVWSSTMDLVTGRYGLQAMSGPVGITQTIGEAARGGGMNLAFLIVIITMNLGVVNLLPLPALDGGRLVFLLLEALRGRPVKPEHEGYVHLAGMILLLTFMIVITYSDLTKLFIGK